ncbi:MAG: (d)CMP kinase, partial [Oscillospiraceae bacterium]|nr:(d)CMP kinase [Oscillospiraceae bacterium]
REFLFGLQKKIAAENNIIMDGRDIGTVVLPNADLKVFLTASAEERANRRFKEMTDKTVTYEQVLEDIRQRDYNDMNREIAPLKQADDAVLLDTTGMTIDEVKAKLKSMIAEVQ